MKWGFCRLGGCKGFVNLDLCVFFLYIDHRSLGFVNVVYLLRFVLYTSSLAILQAQSS